MNEDYKPRFTFEISAEQQLRAFRVLGQFGIRKAMFSVILDDVLDQIEKHGDKFVGAVVSGIVKPSDVIHSINRAKTIAEKISHEKDM